MAKRKKSVNEVFGITADPPPSPHPFDMAETIDDEGLAHRLFDPQAVREAALTVLPPRQRSYWRQVGVTIDGDLYDRIATAAAENRTSVSAVVRRVLVAAFMPLPEPAAPAPQKRGGER